jgi:AcrR family transcriptional regulator
MSASARRRPVRLAREQRISDILHAARDVFCKKGFDGTVVSEIAASLGVAEGTVFKYFPTKRDLLLRVLENWYEEMFGDYARDLAGIKGSRARLRLLVWRHLRALKENPALCRLMFREVRSERDYHGSEVHAMNRRYTQLLIGVMEEGIAAGEFRDDVPVSLLRDLVYGGIEHHAWNYLCGRGSLDVDETADRLVALLCEGIAAPQADDLARQTQRLSRIASQMEKRLMRGGKRA